MVVTLEEKEELNMHLIFDYHTHTLYSHGKGTILENIEVALNKGLKSIAITDHGPGHVTYGVKRKKVTKMRQEVENHNKKYLDINIKLGVEANIIHSNGELDISKDEAKNFDMILAGYHYGVFGNNLALSGLIHMGNYFSSVTGVPIKRLKVMNTEAIIKALKLNDIDILTHPGSKGFVYMDEVANACAKTDTLMEINNSHRHLTVEEIVEAAKTNAKFIINSDAHSPDKVGEFSEGLKRAVAAQLPISRIVNIRED